MSAVQTAGSLHEREAGENFPVALRLLPARHREHLHAVYGFAREVDELGDTYAGDRTAALVRLREETSSIWRGATPISPTLRRLAGTVHECGLSEQPFLDLIEANLRDQQVHRYATFEDLVGYCRLSADPVGRMVLELFGCSTPERVALSDRVCTGLQLVEHLQDVGEDRRAGRIYLPQRSLEQYGVIEADLDRARATAALRRCVLAETDRAQEWLREGSQLVGQLSGWARVAVAGFVAGGLATVAALRAADGDVLARDARPGKARTAALAVAVLVRGRA
ncbi:squalene synthase HpnC [Nocardioides sp. BP30]|uniref:squalene synthase HpnC n=1 Tax=Nocardioides sp. BP30 TaxID=3036374 RepID=UPI0024684441|nr:squalene synthase HpnC [Nocardioides sp. BP30]WGL53022.1 squalene synthase HpnC [Nocardioides sp. BP30]